MKLSLLSLLIGAYRPAEWLEREARTNEIVRRAERIKTKSERLVALAETYRQEDRLVKRR